MFEVLGLMVIVSLDPREGRQHVESVKGKEIDNLYNVAT
jgi:hypothetical protein